MHALRMWVVAEGTDGRLSDDFFPRFGSCDQCWVFAGRPVMYNSMETSVFAIHLNVVTLSRITFPGQRLPEYKRASQRKAPVALLARQRHSPQVTPWLFTVVLRVKFSHRLGIAFVD